jgi:hemerythrin
MEWTQDLSVGVDLIDEQHKELIRRMNALFESMDANRAKAEVLKVLEFLEKYVVTHFTDEENLQKRVQYPKYTVHRQMHQDFIKTIKEQKKEIENGGFTVMTKSLMGATLVTWLVSHISKEDKDIGRHVRANS